MTRGAGFIASPLYDTVLFILAPVLALALVVPVAASPWALAWQPLLGIAERPAILFILVWSHAHAVATFFRSHGNRAIFVQHRFAFVGVPILLLLALMASDWVMVVRPRAGAVLGGLPHRHAELRALQDLRRAPGKSSRHGAPPRLLAALSSSTSARSSRGWSLLAHLESFRLFGDVGWRAPASWVRAHGSVEGVLSGPWSSVGPLFLAFYLHSYWRLTKRGYRPSPQKIALLVTTAARCRSPPGDSSPPGRPSSS